MAGRPGRPTAGPITLSGAKSDWTARKPPNALAPTIAANTNAPTLPPTFTTIPAAAFHLPKGQASFHHQAQASRMDEGQSRVCRKPTTAPPSPPTPHTIMTDHPVLKNQATGTAIAIARIHTPSFAAAADARLSRKRRFRQKSWTRTTTSQDATRRRPVRPEPETSSPRLKTTVVATRPARRDMVSPNRAVRARLSASRAEVIATSVSVMSARCSTRTIRYTENARNTLPSPDGPRSRPASNARPKFVIEEKA